MSNYALMCSNWSSFLAIKFIEIPFAQWMYSTVWLSFIFVYIVCVILVMISASRWRRVGNYMTTIQLKKTKDGICLVFARLKDTIGSRWLSTNHKKKQNWTHPFILKKQPYCIMVRLFCFQTELFRLIANNIRQLMLFLLTPISSARYKWNLYQTNGFVSSDYNTIGLSFECINFFTIICKLQFSNPSVFVQVLHLWKWPAWTRNKQQTIFL